VRVLEVNMASKRAPRIIDGIEHWQCSSCREWVSVDGFNKLKSAPSGRQYQCRKCDRAGCVRSYRKRIKTDPAFKRRASRVFRSNHPGHSIAALAAWRAANPEKFRAYKIIYSAVRSGAIDRPSACCRCGNEVLDTRCMHAHHHDYDKPLDVEWLCSGCHGRRHWND